MKRASMDYSLKKSLGQHFLHDELVCKKIVDCLSPEATHVLEIGPGAGAITKYLIQLPFTEFMCIEIDKEKIDYLQKQYPTLHHQILHDDILTAELPFENDFYVIGNFPYNISTQIVFKMLEWKEHVVEMVGMFQKEVAQRICSKHGSKEYGILSVLTQCYYDVIYCFDVDASCFTPPPKVTSGVIKCIRKANPIIIEQEEAFKKFVKTAFGQRRKTLRNAFKSYYPAAILADPIFMKRAEQLSVSELVDLFHAVTVKKESM
jgi:16S rRNA (adenine1518-N6/adenine1519-N6)-dimethyltransferase